MPQDGLPQKSGGKLPQIRSIALVAVGSNMPFEQFSVETGVEAAIAALSEKLGVIRARSSLYRTPAFPAGTGPEFLNAALAIETQLTATDVLATLHEIERHFGRDRTRRWSPRTLDLDLIGFDDEIRPDRETHDIWAQLPLQEQMQRVPDGLILPHPRLAERAFVLVPLAEVAPDWQHPITGETVCGMRDALAPEALAEVVAL